MPPVANRYFSRHHLTSFQAKGMYTGNAGAPPPPSSSSSSSGVSGGLNANGKRSHPMTLSDALFNSTGILPVNIGSPAFGRLQGGLAEAAQQSPSTLPFAAMCMAGSSSAGICTPSTSSLGLNPWNFGLNPAAAANFLTSSPSSSSYNNTPGNAFNFPYMGLNGAFGGGQQQQQSYGSFDQQQQQVMSPLYSPAIGVNTGNNMCDNNPVVELARRTLVLYRKSTSSTSNAEEEKRYFLNWLTKAFNLPNHAVLEISAACQALRSQGETDCKYWKVAFLVLDDRKTLDNIVSMYENNEMEHSQQLMKQCHIRRGVEVLLEGRRVLSSPSTIEDSSTTPATSPSTQEVEECLCLLHNCSAKPSLPVGSNPSSNSNSRSTPSSANPTPSAFHSFNYLPQATSTPSITSPVVQNLLDAYAGGGGGVFPSFSGLFPTSSGDVEQTGGGNYCTAGAVSHTPTSSTYNPYNGGGGGVGQSQAQFDLSSLDMMGSSNSETEKLMQHIMNITTNTNSFWDS